MIIDVPENRKIMKTYSPIAHNLSIKRKYRLDKTDNTWKCSTYFKGRTKIQDAQNKSFIATILPYKKSNKKCGQDDLKS